MKGRRINMPEPKVIKSGVFPVNNCIIELGTKKTGDVWTYVKVAEMEKGNISIETGIETWTAMENEGWQSALATAKKVTFNLAGKRHLGDPGNDHLASLALKNGVDAYTALKVTFPNKDVFEMEAVADVKDLMGRRFYKCSTSIC
jgi:hypothetical protein